MKQNISTMNDHAQRVLSKIRFQFNCPMFIKAVPKDRGNRWTGGLCLLLLNTKTDDTKIIPMHRRTSPPHSVHLWKKFLFQVIQKSNALNLRCKKVCQYCKLYLKC